MNLALILGIFLDDLKLAKVIPLFKINDKLDINNYRPISLLTSFTKIFEKVIFSRLSNFFNKHSVLVHNQYGFRAGCSTSHTTIDIETLTYDNIDNNQYTGMITFDITKAFYTICH